MGEVWRQPRCRECNKLYLRRRSLFRGRMARLAEQHGVVVRPRPRSVFRVVEVERSDAGRKVLRALRKAAREFNASLPEDRCELDRHGMKVVLGQPEDLDAAQQALFPLEGLPSPARGCQRTGARVVFAGWLEGSPGPPPTWVVAAPLGTVAYLRFAAYNRPAPSIRYTRGGAMLVQIKAYRDEDGTWCASGVDHRIFGSCGEGE